MATVQGNVRQCLDPPKDGVMCVPDGAEVTCKPGQLRALVGTTIFSYTISRFDVAKESVNGTHHELRYRNGRRIRVPIDAIDFHALVECAKRCCSS